MIERDRMRGPYPQIARQPLRFDQPFAFIIVGDSRPTATSIRRSRR